MWVMERLEGGQEKGRYWTRRVGDRWGGDVLDVEERASERSATGINSHFPPWGDGRRKTGQD